MKQSWALQDAKNRFSAVVNRTLSEGPQIVTRHGIPVVAIIPISDLDEKNRDKHTHSDFSEFCGIWDQEQYNDFHAAIADLSQVDPQEWE